MYIVYLVTPASPPSWPPAKASVRHCLDKSSRQSQAETRPIYPDYLLIFLQVLPAVVISAGINFAVGQSLL